MSLDIWFGEDIRNALLAANEGKNPSLEQVRMFLSYMEAGYRAGAVTAVAEAYKQGYAAALMTVALAFGLPAMIIEQRRLL